MLKHVGFGLLLLILVSYAVERFPQKFERPWETEYLWPHNSSVVDYAYPTRWNTDVLQGLLDNLGLGQLSYLYVENKNVERARANYTLAKNIVSQIDDFTNYGLLPYFFNVDKVCKDLGREPEKCSCTLSGGYIECHTNITRSMRQMIARGWFSADYAKAWKGTMNNALNALEESASELNQVLFDLKVAYKDADYTGICSREIAGYEVCENVSSFISAIDAGSTASDYADFARIRRALENNTERVNDDAPLLDFGWVMNVMGNEDGGAMAKVNRMKSTLWNYRNGTEHRYRVLLDEMDSVLAKATQAKENVDREELWRIRAGSYFRSIVGDDAAAVSERGEKGAALLKKAEGAKSAGLFAYAYAEQGYLKAAIANVTLAKALASAAERELEGAMEDAENVILDYEAKTIAALSKVEAKFGEGAWPEKAKVLHSNARKEFRAGRTELRYGLKFEDFVSAIKSAEEAYAVPAEGARDTNWSVIAACTDASDFIKRAESDGLDVGAEKAMLEVLNKAGNATLLVSGCSGIMENLIVTAKEKYSDLGGLRAETIRLVELCSSDCRDIQAGLERVEQGIVSGGKITYPEALGSLRNLREAYFSAKANAGKSIRLQVQKYLSVWSSFFTENAMLDEPGSARLEVEITNTVDYSGENVQAEVGSAIPFDEGDLVYGTGVLRSTTYADGKVRLYLKGINASQKERFVFEKNTTLLRTERISEKAVGFEDYSAVVNEKRKLSCGGKVDGFYANTTWEQLSINGVPVVFENGFAKKQLSEGDYDFEAQYTLAGAYSEIIGSRSSTAVGMRVYEKYVVNVVPAIGMDYLQTLVVIPQSPYVKEKMAIPLSGERLESAETGEGLVVWIYGLKRGKTARFQVSYYVDNSSEYIIKEIENLSTRNISDETKVILGGVMKALERNDTATAVQKIQDAYVQVEKEKRTNAGLEREYRENYGLVSLEFEKIERALGSGEQNENWFVEKLSSRRDFLRDFLDSLEGKELEAQVTLLKTYDRKWLPGQLRALKKNASGEINKMRTAYLDSGVEDVGLSSIFIELRGLYNKFDASGALGDAYVLAAAIKETRSVLDVLEMKAAEESAELLSDAKLLRVRVIETLKKYNSEYGEAKGTKFEHFFKIKSEDVSAMIAQLDVEMKKGNSGAVSKIYDKLLGTEENISGILNYLEGAASRNSQLAADAASAVSGRISEKETKKIASLASAASGHLSEKEWLKALKRYDEILKMASGIEEERNYDAVLWLSAVFVIGVAAVYYYRRRKGGKQWKILRRLEKAV